ncbi:MAG: hypothetical protein KatS3mg065_1190 [Chloroflexota bacterium]|nr:MAG: hypothetical protein KatS3mg065_1190 [Chloroflexota bacterium]
MSLDAYRRKRDFRRTPEPPGAPGGDGGSVGGRFVVQRHRARRLHYDLRLEIGGVLVSWAVPKGPTLDPGARRIAIRVEDHPIEYLDFEGVIPRGEYGAGDVIVWDRGTWEPEPETPDPERALAAGELKFRLRGEKLAGRFVLVRTARAGPRPRGDARTERDRPDRDRAERDRAESGEGGGEAWLLIKKRDEHAVPGWDPEEHPRSVKTGRTNDEVRAASDTLWAAAAGAAEAEIDLSAAVAVEAPPTFIPPMLASLADEPFDDPDWLFEVKWDGFRVEAIVADGAVQLFTRNGHDAAAYFPRLLPPPDRWLRAREAILDGEVVALDPAGRPDFDLLQGWIAGDAEARRAPVVYEVFDLLRIDGRSLLAVPLEARKRLLRAALLDGPRVRYAGHVAAEGRAFFEAARNQGLEGIVAKRRRSPYEPGRRSPNWLKLKARLGQELVVGGWLPGQGSARDLGALLVGVFEGDRLRYAGRVGSGFDAAARRRLRHELEALAADAPPFEPAPEPRGPLAPARWVRPRLVIRAEVGGWTRDGLVRQASYKGLELDRDPPDVVRERPGDAAVLRRLAVPEGAAPEGAAPGSSSVARDEAPRPTPLAPPTGIAARRAALPVGPPAATPAPAPGRRPSPAPERDADGRLLGPNGRPWSITEAELAALRRIGSQGLWRVAGRELRLTNLDKVLFPPRPGSGEPPISKRELIEYFVRIAPTMLPHLLERPLNLHRFPDGVGAPGFWQKDLRPTDPAWLRRWREPLPPGSKREPNVHLVAEEVATLAWLANRAAFEIHPWTVRCDDPLHPTFALVDIDPGTETTWQETVLLARLFRDALAHLQVRGYPKLTGRRGIQIWIPIVPRYTYAETSRWVERLSRTVAAVVPDLVSWEWAVAERGGRARLDYTQNSPIRTLVAAYAVRPAPGAPVSAPISWDELEDPDLRSDRWTIRTILDRVAAVGDPFAAAQTDAQELPELA